MRVSPARLAVLRAAERGEVIQGWGSQTPEIRVDGKWQAVTAKISWLVTAGLLRRVHRWPSVRFELTDAGREVLAETGDDR